MLGPGRRPFRRGRVFPVVGSEFELGQVQDRVAAVHLELGEGDAPQVLGRAQLRLVIRVGEPFAAVPRRRQPGQAGPDAFGRQVLRLAVVFMPSAVLAHHGDIEIADRAQPRGEVHGLDATGPPAIAPVGGHRIPGRATTQIDHSSERNVVPAPDTGSQCLVLGALPSSSPGLVAVRSSLLWPGVALAILAVIGLFGGFRFDYLAGRQRRIPS